MAGESLQQLDIKCYIYALLDPRTQETRYIGKTVNYDRRYAQHLSEAKRGKTAKDKWIRKLLANGLLPEMILLEVVAHHDWEEAEIFWIGYFKMLGAKLVNLTSGGVGRALSLDHLKALKVSKRLELEELKTNLIKETMSHAILHPISPKPRIDKSKIWSSSWAKNLTAKP